MRYRVDDHAEYAVIHAHGELDAGSVDPLRATIRAGFDSGLRRVVVDLSQVTFIDSTGTSALVTEHQAAEGRRVALCLVAPSQAVARVLHMLGLDLVLHVYATLEEALVDEGPAG